MTKRSSNSDTAPAVRHNTASISAASHSAGKDNRQTTRRRSQRSYHRYSARESIYGQKR